MYVCSSVSLGRPVAGGADSIGGTFLSQMKARVSFPIILLVCFFQKNNS